MSTYMGATNFQKQSGFFWPTLYNRPTGCSGVPSSGSRRGSVADLEGPGPGAAAPPGPGLVCLAGLRVRLASVFTTAYSISDVKTNSKQIIIQMSIACTITNRPPQQHQ